MENESQIKSFLDTTSIKTLIGSHRSRLRVKHSKCLPRACLGKFLELVMTCIAFKKVPPTCL